MSVTSDLYSQLRCRLLIVPVCLNGGVMVVEHLRRNTFNVLTYTPIKTLTDCPSLQKALDKVYDWSVAHQLPISARKCSCIVLGNVDTSNTVYNIGKCHDTPLVRP